MNGTLLKTNEKLHKTSAYVRACKVADHVPEVSGDHVEHEDSGEEADVLDREGDSKTDAQQAQPRPPLQRPLPDTQAHRITCTSH